MSSTNPHVAAPPKRILALLLLAYVFNFVDRNIIGILAVPIRSEFGLSDTALSSLGVAFGIFYAILAVPVAWVADRRSRVSVIAAAVAVWSLFTAACGLAQSFLHLVIARMGVAAGEAGGIAPSYSLIADYYPRSRRSRALAFFSLGIPIGSALGVAFGGWLTAHLSWRSAFIIVGLLGLPVAAMIRLWIAEPKRGGLDEAPAQATRAVRTDRTFLASPSFWLLSFGAALGSIPGYGLMFWLPSFFSRSLGLEVDQVGWFYGSIILVGGMIGTWAGGIMGDRLGAAKPAHYALIPASCFLVTAPAFAVGLFSSNLYIAWLVFTLGQTLALAWLGPVITAVQHLVAPTARATVSASFLFINNLVGIAFGIFFLGFMSDQLKQAHGENALQYSILYALGFYLLSSLVYAVAATRLSKDWHQS